MKKYLKNYCKQTHIFNHFKSSCKISGLALEFDKKFYEKLQTKIGEETIGSILKKSDTLGKCYFYALLLAKGLEGATLVHGILHRLDISIEDGYYDEFKHAWVEKGGLVYDTTAKMIFDKNVYYKRMEAEVVKKYSPEQLKDKITFVKLGKHAVCLRPVLKSRLAKICREWEMPMDNIKTKNSSTGFDEKSL